MRTAKAADVRALAEACPWDDEDFRADLALLSDSTAAEAREHAARARALARLAARVPRCALDETGATPWTSFRTEVAVARRLSTQAAAAEIRSALLLTRALPRTLALLEAGVLPVPRAKAFVAEVEIHPDDIASRIDAELAERLPLLSAPRIAQEVRRAALRLDPDSAALRTATKNAARSVTFTADRDDQASVWLSGPAVPLTRWYASLDTRARALKQTGDPRTLDNLRFDLATSTSPCATHAPADSTVLDAGSMDAPATDVSGPVAGGPADTAADDISAHRRRSSNAAGLRPAFVEPAPTDCRRRRRPVQAHIVVPVETALGLSNEPGWLDGYGWLSAPTSRQLLIDAELRRLCADTRTGQLVDSSSRTHRPPPTADGVRHTLLDLVLQPITLDDTAWRTEPQHDPSPALREHVVLRDRTCDGPTATLVPARRCQLDHDTAYPHGPTAAWNLAARGTRTHQLKHYGWTPLRTPTATLWTSPAGQLVTVPRDTTPPPGTDPDPDPDGRPPALPDPDALADLDRAQLTAPTDDDLPPWLPDSQQHDDTIWTWLSDETAEPAPF